MFSKSCIIKRRNNTEPECIICLEQKGDAVNRCGTCKGGNICNQCNTQLCLTGSDLSVSKCDFVCKCPLCRSMNTIPVDLHTHFGIQARFFTIIESYCSRPWDCPCCECRRECTNCVDNILGKHPYLTSMTNRNGDTIMHAAAGAGNVPIMQVIHRHGGSFHVENDDGDNPLVCLRWCPTDISDGDTSDGDT